MMNYLRISHQINCLIGLPYNLSSTPQIKNVIEIYSKSLNSILDSPLPINSNYIDDFNDILKIHIGNVLIEKYIHSLTSLIDVDYNNVNSHLDKFRYLEIMALTSLILHQKIIKI